MENVRRDSLGLRGSFDMEGHSSQNSRVYKTQEHGLGGHRSSGEQEQERGPWDGDSGQMPNANLRA